MENKTLYVYTDLEWYGSFEPVCFAEMAAIRIWKSTLRDRGMDEEDLPFDELFREASESEATEWEIDVAGFGC